MTSKNLIKLGLTEGEAKVYLALLKLGSSTVGPAVKESRIAYSNIYEVLERLLKKGLISYIIKDKTRYFSAAEPNRLKDYLNAKEQEIEKQKSELNKLIPSLVSIKNSQDKETHAEIFTGTKGLKTAYEKMIAGVTKKDEILFFYIHEKEYAEQSDNFYNSIFDLTKKIKAKGLANKEYKNSWLIKKAKHFNTKFVDFPLPGNIDIIKNRVMIVSWHPEIVAVLINSESISKHFKDYFNKIWHIAK